MANTKTTFDSVPSEQNNETIVPWLNAPPVDFNLLLNQPDSFLTYYSKWDWSDGDVTISWTVTLTRDMYYNNLTVPASTTLLTDWYSVAVKWTLTNQWTISHNGNSWSNAVWIVGGAGGTAINQGTLGINYWGKKWGNWWDFATILVLQEDWVSGDNSNPSYSNTNAVAGASGGNNSGWLLWNGWTAWTTTRWVNYNVYLNIANALTQLSMPTRNYNVLYNWLASSGWSGWGKEQGYLTQWGWAGGSGSNWGIIVIHCNRYEWTGVIRVKWGNGWTGAAGANLWGGAGWWGGWGGSGWSGWVIFFTYTAWIAPTTDVSGGTGGTGWASIWFGWAGANGNTGASGVAILINK